MSVRHHPPTWLLHGGRPASQWLVRRRYDVRQHGAGQLPTRGPAIVAANHTGVTDGPLMAIFGPRSVHALTKREMFDGPLSGVLRAAGQIPLDRFRTAWPWPRTKRLVAETSAALQQRMRADLTAGLSLIGQNLLGPIPARTAEEI